MIALQLPSVPMPDAVVVLIASQIPERVLRAEMDATFESADICRYRPLVSDEDRSDREEALARLAGLNKTLAQYSPKLVVRGAR
ncbi:hypothetical protein PUR59_30595 [Streptomyces sp. SP18ES09]|uniref:hypothetical protein n=1 Tax=Streptomyces sp. SP18ES09 TaxID=3002532 RepID=UPI002E75B0A5|nr:hypothetical protein [Streptomyces sp. SP18ES09]MEE1819351.1 hypothetical protein [Streptomyces sp. SP18ES09]